MYRFKLNIPVATVSMALTIVVGTALVGCSEYTTVEPKDTPAATTESTTPTADPLDGALQPRKLWEREYTTTDGVTVTCLSMEDSALSCDWTGATRHVQ